MPVSADSSLETAANEVFAVGLAPVGNSDFQQISIKSLPADTILSSGSDVAISTGGEPIDLSGWNLDHLEITPPIGFEGAMDPELTIVSQAINGGEVTVSKSIQISVGDADAVLATDPQLQEELLIGDQSSNDPGWDDPGLANLGHDQESGDAGSGDIMDEAVVVADESGSEVVSFDTYERQDW